MAFWMIRLLITGIWPYDYLAGLKLLPLQFSLALGPLIYFYVLKLTRPEYKFSWKDALHFSPVLLQLIAQLFPVKSQLNAPLLLSTIISVIIYLYLSHRLIESFYQRLKFIGGDRYRTELRWLHRLLVIFGLLWLLRIPYTAVNYFAYHNQLNPATGYPLYLFLTITMIWTGATAFLRPELELPVALSPALKPPASTELKQKGIWLKKAMEANRFYRDAELSLSSLAEKMDIHPHELSRIINIALKKNFSDFVNEYRIREVAQKMQAAAYGHITLVGMAFDSGFNSKATFNRAFKQMTGKSPKEYKNDLKKEYSTYHLRRFSDPAPIISIRETTPVWFDKKLNRIFMFKNYLKIAWRNLLRHRVFTVINIAGLAIGMASSALILLWIQNEVSYDRFHQKAARLYEVYKHSAVNGKFQSSAITPMVMAKTLKQEYPQVEETARTTGANFLFTVGEQLLNVNGAFTGPSFLTMFSFPLIDGNAKTALNNIHSIVITQKLSRKLFGNTNAMGKTIKIDSNAYFTVTGVLKDLPNNTQFDFEYLMPWDYLVKIGGEDNNWADNSLQTWVLLKPGVTEADADSRVRNIIGSHSSVKNTTIFLHPLNKLRLYTKFDDNGKISGGRIETVRIFGLIAVFILLIACINFMNLSTARSEKRAREVGIRKVAGARKNALIFQFWGESILIAFMSGCIALVVVLLFLPQFNLLVQAQLFLPFDSPLFWLASIGFILFTGTLAGSYPALYLSSFNPVRVLKGSFKASKALIAPRKLLVVIQFTFAVILIICTIIIREQLQYAQDKDTGYDKANLVYVMMTGDAEKNYAVIKNELLGSGAATAVSKTSAPITQAWSDSFEYDWQGKTPGKILDFDVFNTDGDLVKTMGLKMVAGRDIDTKTYPTDSMAMLLNESAVKIMGFKNPVGQIIKRGTGANVKDWHVVGVIKDFILHSPYEPTTAMIIQGPKSWFNVIHFKLNPANTTAKNLETAGAIFKKYNPAYPFEYNFADQDYAKKFGDEQRTGTLASLFAGLTIIIACLGLFGLAAYMAQNRLKEIGVRKVMGASVAGVAVLLSKEFLKLVMLSFIIAAPVAWLAMYRWLQSYTYRVPITIWVFAIAALLTVLISVVTVSFQAVKAALANPAMSLRNE